MTTRAEAVEKLREAIEIIVSKYRVSSGLHVSAMIREIEEALDSLPPERREPPPEAVGELHIRQAWTGPVDGAVWYNQKLDRLPDGEYAVYLAPPPATKPAAVDAVLLRDAADLIEGQCRDKAVAHEDHTNCNRMGRRLREAADALDAQRGEGNGD